MSNVLITGATGFVGLALAKILLAEGDRVVSLVRDFTRDPIGFVVRGDVTDADVCRRAIADYQIDTVYHLAAQSIVSACAEDPVTAVEVAAVGTARLLQAVRESGRPVRVVVSTSDKVYGSAPAPYDEYTPLDARRAYEVSKACQDLVARMFHSNYGVDVRVARAVNIYGPGDPNESRLVPQTIIRYLRGDLPLVHDGASVMRRQYVYVDDFVTALRTIVEYGSPGEAYCVGGHGSSLTVLEVICEVARQMGRDFTGAQIGARDIRFQEIPEQAVCDDKMRALDWKPQIAFDEGVRRTIAWYRGQRSVHDVLPCTRSAIQSANPCQSNCKNLTYADLASSCCDPCKNSLPDGLWMQLVASGQAERRAAAQAISKFLHQASA